MVSRIGVVTSGPPAACALSTAAWYWVTFELPIIKLARPRTTSTKPTMNTREERRIRQSHTSRRRQWSNEVHSGQRFESRRGRGYRRQVPAQPNPVAQAATIRVESWGLLPYEEALTRQLDLHCRRVGGQVGDTIVSVEHPPTVTLGRNAPAEDIVASPSELERRGIALVRSDRGGRATYHGPGQAVVYPIVDIEALRLGVRGWVCLLEKAVLATLDEYGIAGDLIPGQPGVWAHGAKIASLGLRIVRGVSYHGVSVNVSLDAAGFDCIVTCGVTAAKVTTIATETGADPTVEEVSSRLTMHLVEAIEGRR